MAIDDQISTHVFKTTPGLSLKIDVSAPEGFNPESGTCVLHFHGGFLIMGDKSSWTPHWLVNACHKRGWAYATPSYRLLPEANGQEALQDAVDAAIWTRDNFAKSDRLIIAGASAGGYLALATTAHPRSPPALACLLVYGMLDFADARYLHPGKPTGAPIEDIDSAVDELYAAISNAAPIDAYTPPLNPPSDKRFHWINTIHQAAIFPDILTGVRGLTRRIEQTGVEAIPSELRLLFPLSFGLHERFPPTVLLHGDDDVPVSVNLSIKTAEALEKLGVKVLLEVVKGEGHGFEVKTVPTDIDILGDFPKTEVYESLSRTFQFLEKAADGHFQKDH